MGLSVTAFAIGIAPHWIWGRASDALSPWYVALFAMGMIGAHIATAPRPPAAQRWPWGLIAALLAAGTLGLLGAAHAWSDANRYVSDPAAGLATIALIIALTLQETSRRPPSRLLALLRSRPAVWLGTMSYSLYLVHFPVMALISLNLRRAGWTAPHRLMTLLIAGTAASLAISFAFHLVFERPFLPGSPRAALRAATLAVVEPAP
jgi:peptidoglycan/LPS O-acetylase OafA/YrhL